MEYCAWDITRGTLLAGNCAWDIECGTLRVGYYGRDIARGTLRADKLRGRHHVWDAARTRVIDLLCDPQFIDRFASLLRCFCLRVVVALGVWSVLWVCGRCSGFVVGALGIGFAILTRFDGVRMGEGDWGAIYYYIL